MPRNNNDIPCCMNSWSPSTSEVRRDDHASRRLVREVVEVESVQVREQPAAEIGEVALAEHAHPPELDVRTRGDAEREHEADGDAPHDRAGRLVHEAVVDGGVHDHGHRDLADDAEDDAGERDVPRTHEGPEVGDEPSQRDARGPLAAHGATTGSESPAGSSSARACR